jgi:glycosyltransferase involved in cell wall biosynthesis
MRIWLLTSELPHEVAGGIARYVENFARILGTAGHEVVIIARTEQACDKTLAQGVRLIGIVPRFARLYDPNPDGIADAHPAYPYNLLAYWPAFSYQMAEEVLRLLQQLPLPDSIESHEYTALPYYLLHRKLTERTLLERIPILVQLHSPTFELAIPNQEPRYRLPDYWVAQMEKFCILAADGLLAPSAFLAHRVKTALRQSLDIATIPLPVLNAGNPPLRTTQPGQIVYVGRLELRKGVVPLVKACTHLWKDGVDFRLSLVGGDVDFLPRNTTVGEFLKYRYARWIASGHLRIVGQVPHSEVLTQMRQAWAVVVPSLWENFPNTCLEAMGAGQVVLASQTGGQVEMIEANGVNGFLFDWQSPGDFEQKLHSVLSLGEAERFAIAQRAQERIRTLCAPEVVLPQRLRHYESVIARHAPRPIFPTVNALATDQSPSEVCTPDVSLLREEEQRRLLSVVIPFYNLGAYLEDTLASIRATSYLPYEVIIVNDGSTDPKSLELLQKIEEQGVAHIRLVHTENQGLASARNVGAEVAKGEFLAFVDADDLVEPDFFPRAIEVLRRYANVAFVYSWVRYFGESSDIWPTWNAELPYLLAHNMLIPIVVTRRSLFLQSGKNKPEFEYNFEDYDGWVGLVEAGEVGVSLAHPLVRYRVRPGSMYQSSNRNQQLYLYDLLTQHHADSYRKWGVELFNLQNANGPGHVWNHPAQSIESPSQPYFTALVQERDKLAAEVRTLGRAWEDQVRFIADQRAYIESLEARSREIIALNGNSTSIASAGNGVTSREYELGGQLVNRLRRMRIVRWVLRSSTLKKTLKKTLRM